jgi:hypothetical protein
MNLQEFNSRLKELDGQVAAVLQWFESDTGVTVGSLLVELDENGEYTVFTGLDFPEEETK